jgi:hypothetical protein
MHDLRPKESRTVDDDDYTLEGDGGITADANSELLEVLEERRLRRLGIDPDLPQWEIYKELKKRMAKIEAGEAERERAEGDSDSSGT